MKGKKSMKENTAIYYLNNCTNFDVIGDVHSCYYQLVELLISMGYVVDKENNKITHSPKGRFLIFVGDLVDRGQYPIEVLSLVMTAVKEKFALCARGNHEHKLYRALIGNQVQINEDLKYTLEEIEKQDNNFKNKINDFLSSLPYQIVINNGETIIAHGGLTEKYHGVNSKSMKAMATFGKPTGKKDEHGHPIRLDWAKDYRGEAYVIYGHTPITYPVWTNNTINIDTRCFNTSILSAIRMPEKEIFDTR